MTEHKGGRSPLHTTKYMVTTEDLNLTSTMIYREICDELIAKLFGGDYSTACKELHAEGLVTYDWDGGGLDALTRCEGKMGPLDLQVIADGATKQLTITPGTIIQYDATGATADDAKFRLGRLHTAYQPTVGDHAAGADRYVAISAKYDFVDYSLETRSWKDGAGGAVTTADINTKRRPDMGDSPTIIIETNAWGWASEAVVTPAAGYMLLATVRIPTGVGGALSQSDVTPRAPILRLSPFLGGVDAKLASPMNEPNQRTPSYGTSFQNGFYQGGKIERAFAANLAVAAAYQVVDDSIDWRKRPICFDYVYAHTADIRPGGGTCTTMENYKCEPQTTGLASVAVTNFNTGSQLNTLAYQDVTSAVNYLTFCVADGATPAGIAAGSLCVRNDHAAQLYVVGAVSTHLPMTDI